MENIKTNEELIEEQFRRVLTPIFSNFPKEQANNPVMVGGGVGVMPKKCLYKPHNLRLYFDYFLEGFNPALGRGRGGVGAGLVTYKQDPKSKDHIFKDFYKCTIIVRKNSIEIINLINPIWYNIEISEYSRDLFNNIIEEKIKEAKEVLKKFIEYYGGSSQLNLLKFSSEDKIQGEDLINQINPNDRFLNRVGKKVYNENNFEFKSPIYASNYIENQAIESKTPAIETQLKQIKETLINKIDLREDIKKANHYKMISLKLIGLFEEYINFKNGK